MVFQGVKSTHYIGSGHNSPEVSGSPNSNSSQIETLIEGGSIESRRVRRISEDRPKLDKSHSSPAYDFEDKHDSVFFERFVFLY